MSRLQRARSFGPLGLACLLACICLLAAGAVPALGASPEPSPSASSSASLEAHRETSASPGASASPSHGASPGASADPRSAAPDLLEPVDTRSEGSGPGLVGSPLTILLGVMALGILSALITAAWVRLTRQG